MSIGQRLQALRENKGLTIKEVAHRLGISASTYRDWELGTRISGEPYIKLSEEFGVPLSYLMTGEMSNQDELVNSIKQIKRILEIMEKNINLGI